MKILFSRKVKSFTSKNLLSLHIIYLDNGKLLQCQNSMNIELPLNCDMIILEKWKEGKLEGSRMV